MTPENDRWLHWAERVDAMRVFPRLFVAGYGVLAWDVWRWVQSLHDMTVAQTAFTTSIIGLCIPLLGWYMNTGRKWV